MNFADILEGNEALVEVLSGMVRSGRIPHAIMLHEDDGGGAVAIALSFLEQLYSGSGKISKLIHPDVHFIFPVTSGDTTDEYLENWRSLVLSNPLFTEEDLGEALGIETKSSIIAVPQAKAVLDTLSLSALEGGYRSVLVYLPEKFNTEAANRLLKSIEEPEPMTQFVFITHSPEKVLQTIASRCQTLRVIPRIRKSPVNDRYEEILDGVMASLISRNLPSLLEAMDAVADLPSREHAKAFCRFACDRFREMFLCQQNLSNLSCGSEKIDGWASSCSKTFPRAALEIMTRAQSLLERNVNTKIIFTDAADRLYLKI